MSPFALGLLGGALIAVFGFGRCGAALDQRRRGAALYWACGSLLASQVLASLVVGAYAS